MTRAGFLVLLASTGVLAAEPPPPGRTKSQPCATCHGPSGLSNAPDTPSLAGQPRIYLVAQLKAYRGGTRQHEVMSLMAKTLSDADIDELAAWFSSLKIEVQPLP